MMLSAIFLYLVVEELNSSKPNQLQKGVASPHVSPSVQLIQTLLRLIFVRENQRPLGLVMKLASKAHSSISSIVFSSPWRGLSLAVNFAELELD